MSPRAALLASVVLSLAGCLTGLPGGGDDATDGPATTFRAACFAAVAAWPDACTTLASPNESPSKAEIDLAVDPLDPLHVVVASKDLDRAASDCVWSVAQVTFDGGATWTTSYVGGDKTSRARELLPFACVTDPIMVFGQDGTLYYALQAYRLGAGPTVLPPTPLGNTIPIVGSTFILARSSDGGLTWEHYALQHAGDGTAVFHDYPRMLLNPASGSVHTIWNGVGSSPAPGAPGSGVNPWVSTSRDGGETVDAPVAFYAQDAPRDTQFFSGFDARSDGTIFVTANHGQASDAGEPTDVWLWRSDDDARSFQLVGKALTIAPTPRQLETNEFRTPSFVELAVDRSGGAYDGRIHLFWPDYATGDSDILSSFSDDEGATWSAPVDVATDATNDQLFMRPKVGRDGTVHVLFASRAWDPANVLLDQVHAWSADGGATWRNERLTETSFDGDLGVHQNGFPFIGDYNGIDVGPDGTVWMAWGDTRTGVAEIAVAKSVPTSG